MRLTIAGIVLLTIGWFASPVLADRTATVQEHAPPVRVEEVVPITKEDYMLKPTVLVRKGNASGSGVAFATDDVSGTRILTNYHVIAGEIGGITVQFHGNLEIAYIAYIVSYDKELDLAVLVIEETVAHVVILGTMEDVQVFDEAYCTGSPMGLPPMVTKGIISNADLERPDNNQHYFQTDCKIFSGNSGGGLFVQRGEQWVLVGLNDWVLTGPVVGAPFGGRTVIPHLGFAIRIDDIRGHLQKYGMNPV